MQLALLVESLEHFVIIKSSYSYINNKKPINEFIDKAKWVKADLRCPNVLKDYLPNTDILLQFAAYFELKIFFKDPMYM